MTDDELGRLLSGAFDDKARAEVGDHAAPPPPRFATEPARRPRRVRSARVMAPLLAAAAVIAVVAVVFGIARTGGNGHHVAGPGAPSSVGSAHVTTTGGHVAPSTPVTKVHIKLLNSDGSEYGVGMPVIAYFSKKITDARALQDATTATVNGKAVKGAWYFETSDAGNGPYEAHFRLQNYWPAHAQIDITIPTKGLSAGTGLAYDDSLTLHFTTGPANISTVDDTTHMITVTSDGRQVYKYPVSLGATDTPTSKGVKVIMEKGASICMKGPGYNECGIRYTQRLTYGGEYLHAAPWNCTGSAGCTGPADNIGHADSSNGCTNLTPANAKTLYSFLRIGDVVTFPNANGGQMQLGQGYGDWNVSWTQWQTGGLVPTR